MNNHMQLRMVGSHMAGNTTHPMTLNWSTISTARSCACLLNEKEGGGDSTDTQQ